MDALLISVVNSDSCLFSLFKPLEVNLPKIFHEIVSAQLQIYSTGMANQWRIAVVTCVVLFMMMEDTNPVLATGECQCIRRLEDRLKALEEKCTDKSLR